MGDFEAEDDFCIKYKTWLNIGKATGVFDFGRSSPFYDIADTYEDAIKLASLDQVAIGDVSYFHDLVRNWEEVEFSVIGTDIHPGFSYKVTSGVRYAHPELTVIWMGDRWKISTNAKVVFESDKKDEIGPFILKWILSVL